MVRRNLSAENSGPLLQGASEAHCQALREIIMTYVVENFDRKSRFVVSRMDSSSLTLMLNECV